MTTRLTTRTRDIWNTAFSATMLLIGLTGLLMLLTTRACYSQAQPMPKTGQCPSGYSTSGGFCSPMSDAKHAIQKGAGQCPSGYMQSGNYCLKM